MLKNIIKRLRDLFHNDLPSKEDLNRIYDQFAGLIQIQNAMEGRPILRPMRGWAISPDAMNWILADLQERDAPTVIEFGSGQSTIIFAAALKRNNGRLYSVEHDPVYCDVIRTQLIACGLETRVEFIHAPLSDGMGPPPIHSYDTSALPAITVDLALIDGPPYMNGPLTRLTPLRWAAEHINPRGTIFLDDSARQFEQSCLNYLTNEHPNLQRIEHRAEKGLTALHCPPGGAQS